MKRLHHPNIVQLIDSGWDDANDCYYIILEYLPDSLQALIERKDKRFEDPNWIWPTIREIADALSHAHSENVIHRDIKPSNILLDSDGTPKLSGFNISRIKSELSVGETVSSFLTPGYASPEQRREEEVDIPSDIYSFGAVCYAIISKHPPRSDAISPDDLKSLKIPEHIQKILLKMVERKPDQRYQSCSELIRELDYSKRLDIPPTILLILTNRVFDSVNQAIPDLSPNFEDTKEFLISELGGHDVEETRAFLRIPDDEPQDATLVILGKSVRLICDVDSTTSAIISYASNEKVELSPNKQELTLHDISHESGVITTINIRLQVNPKMPEVESLPEVWVGWRETVNSGTARASSISRGIEYFGSRTLSAEGECLWDWDEYVSHVVSWPLVTRGVAETKNEILVNFANRWVYQVWGDEFTNREVSGGRDLYTTMINGPDETGESIRGLCLTLTTDQETEEVYKLVAGHIEGSVELGPPEYKWRFGEVPEEPENWLGTGGAEGIALFPTSMEDMEGYWRDLEAAAKKWRETGEEIDIQKMDFPNLFPAKWSPGFDFTRSADQTVFTSPGTQTLTITIIPREEKIDKLTVEVDTSENERVEAVIISATKEEHLLPTSGAHNFYLSDIPMELNVSWTVTLTIQVTPKVPKMEYMPYVEVNWLGGNYNWTPMNDTTSGSFVSVEWEEMGTWTWSAEGDYLWKWWRNVPVYSVSFYARSEELPDN